MYKIIIYISTVFKSMCATGIILSMYQVFHEYEEVDWVELMKYDSCMMTTQ
jgi:hypothetical protein